MFLMVNHNSIITIFATLLFFFVSCEKEYSYEAGTVTGTPVLPPADTVAHTDSVVAGIFTPCTACTSINGNTPGSWSFKTGNAQVCGEVDTAFTLNHERDVLTFFGPSFCGSDSGLIFTVNLSSGLTANAVNIPASFTAYYYYHTGSPNILVSLASQPFNLMITSYNHSAHIATGTFSGTAYSQQGAAVPVTEGKFSFVIN